MEYDDEALCNRYEKIILDLEMKVSYLKKKNTTLTKNLNRYRKVAHSIRKRYEDCKLIQIINLPEMRIC
jgi:hypothetical protein